MTDRELLELAAKAARIPVFWCEELGEWLYKDETKRAFKNTVFNPLTDDGDNARLESTLELHVEWHPALNQVRVGRAEVNATEPYGKDRQAARRRACVRAAAEIGKTM